MVLARVAPRLHWVRLDGGACILAATITRIPAYTILIPPEYQVYASPVSFMNEDMAISYYQNEVPLPDHDAAGAPIDAPAPGSS